jgi:hypothetical protein
MPETIHSPAPVRLSAALIVRCCATELTGSAPGLQKPVKREKIGANG